MALSFLIIAINFFVACDKTNTRHEKKKITTHALNQDELYQAEELDIPIPLGYKNASNDSQGNVNHYVYEGSLSIAKTKEFYLQEMERMGWDIANLSSPQESLLLCTKTIKQCALSIRPYLSEKKNRTNIKTLIHIFVQKRGKHTLPSLSFL